MDTRLDQNETEFRIFVLPVALEMLAHGHGLHTERQHQPEFESKRLRLATMMNSDGYAVTYLLNQEVEVLGQFGCKACSKVHSVSHMDQSRGSVEGIAEPREQAILRSIVLISLRRWRR
jgi:hypothetical protein